MTFSEIGEPQVPTDQDLLVGFLIELQADLDAWTTGEGVNPEVEGSILFPDTELRSLARAAFEDGVDASLSQAILALRNDWPLYEPALRVNGLTGPNLLLKTTMAGNFRNPAPDRTRSTRRLFADLSRYLGIGSSVLSSLKDVLENKMPWWAKVVLELANEFADMAEAQASARSEPPVLRGGRIRF